jgi:hypothetical protein
VVPPKLAARLMAALGQPQPPPANDAAALMQAQQPSRALAGPALAAASARLAAELERCESGLAGGLCGFLPPLSLAQLAAQPHVLAAAPPEVLLGCPLPLPASDAWAFGVCAATLLLRRPVFAAAGEGGGDAFSAAVTPGAVAAMHSAANAAGAPAPPPPACLAGDARAQAGILAHWLRVEVVVGPVFALWPLAACMPHAAWLAWAVARLRAAQPALPPAAPTSPDGRWKLRWDALPPPPPALAAAAAGSGDAGTRLHTEERELLALVLHPDPARRVPSLRGLARCAAYLAQPQRIAYLHAPFSQRQQAMAAGVMARLGSGAAADGAAGASGESGTATTGNSTASHGGDSAEHRPYAYEPGVFPPPGMPPCRCGTV